jgi:hypothetical protein
MFHSGQTQPSNEGFPAGAARFDTLTKGRSLMFHSGQTQPSNEVCAMLADKE